MYVLMNMAKRRRIVDNFFYWEGNPPPRYNNVMTWWVEPTEAGGETHKYGTGNLGRNGTHWESDFPIGKWHQLAMQSSTGRRIRRKEIRGLFDSALLISS